MIVFENERHRKEWLSPQVHPILRKVVNVGVEYAESRLKWNLVVTSIWRSFSEDKALEGTGIHPAWRAVDFRTHDRSSRDVAALVNYLEERWVYDPTRPSKPIAYAKPHGNGPHLHVQVHDLTVPEIGGF